MDNDKKKELLESFCAEMGIRQKEEEDQRTEYIASSNTLKVNKATHANEVASEERKEETIEDKLRKVAEAYKTDAQRIEKSRGIIQ